jgi:hypothetical protein
MSSESVLFEHSSDELRTISESSDQGILCNENDAKDESGSSLRPQFVFFLIISIKFIFVIDIKRFYSCLNLTNLGIILFALFTSIVMTTGISIVCFTSPKSSMLFIDYFHF